MDAVQKRTRSTVVDAHALDRFAGQEVVVNSERCFANIVSRLRSDGGRIRYCTGARDVRSVELMLCAHFEAVDGQKQVDMRRTVGNLLKVIYTAYTPITT